MSRVGNKIIKVPSGVSVEVRESEIAVKGGKGALNAPVFPGISVIQEGNTIKVARATDSKIHRAQHGLVRALLANVITGCSTGFRRNLILEGVGYRAAKKGKQLVLSLGYSHEVIFDEPADVSIEVPEPTKISITGIDKQRVGQVAAQIREFRKPEPYKGKGVRYEGERIRRKAGKTGKK